VAAVLCASLRRNRGRRWGLGGRGRTFCCLEALLELGDALVVVASERVDQSAQLGDLFIVLSDRRRCGPESDDRRQHHTKAPLSTSKSIVSIHNWYSFRRQYETYLD
jgi:hypothetical protein